MTHVDNNQLYNKHVPVLPNELIEHCKAKDNSSICDATLGLGGHAEAILKQVKKCNFLGIDADPEALEHSKARLEGLSKENRLYFVHSNYSKLSELHRRLNLPKLDIIYYDLGVSSKELEDPRRGFSFQNEGPLDMRMDSTQGITAAEILNSYPEKELAKILFEYGEESFAKMIAKEIVKQRNEKPFESTLELAKLVLKVKGPKKRKGSKIHPATLSFQALRIAVNKELESLRTSLKAAFNLLKPGGRVLVISFHSLEDRIVKEEFKLAASTCICSPDAPICVCKHERLIKIINKKPIRPKASEIKNNPRSRSAKLRIGERI